MRAPRVRRDHGDRVRVVGREFEAGRDCDVALACIVTQNLRRVGVNAHQRRVREPVVKNIRQRDSGRE